MSRRPAHQAWEKRKGGGRERPPSRPSSLARCGHPEGKQTLRAFCLPGWTPAEAPHPGGSTLPAPHTRASGLCSSLTGHTACDSTRHLLQAAPQTPPRTLGSPPGACVRHAQQHLSVSRLQFVLRQTLWHGRGLGESGNWLCWGSNSPEASQAAAPLLRRPQLRRHPWPLAEGEGRVGEVSGFVGHMSSRSHV